MTAAWITRDKDGVVTAGIIAQYADAADLKAWRKDGRKPELVDFGPGNGCKVGVRLPETARVIDTGDR